MRSLKTQSGFTLLEIVIVIAIMLLITAFAISGFRNYTAHQQYTQSVRQALIVLQTAQTAARLSVAGEPHGVKIGTSTLIQFTGATYSANDPNNATTTFTNIRFEPVLGGGDEIVFSELSALPSVSGTVEVGGIQYQSTTTITVSAGGVVEWQ